MKRILRFTEFSFRSNMDFFKLFIWVLPGLFDRNSANSELYKDYQLIKVHAFDATSFNVTKEFEDPNSEVEIFKRPRTPTDSLDLLVPPSRRSFIEKFARDNELSLDVKVTNYAEKLQTQNILPSSRRSGSDFDLYSYQDAENIEQYLELLQEKYPKLVKLESLNTTEEGRRIIMLKISADPDKRNPIIMIDAGTHAREWFSISMALYIINQLVEKKENVKMLSGVDWHIIPLVNPDGYEYSRKSDRLWRKNRSYDKSSGCYGVDLNRNYGYKWGGARMSKKPCKKNIYGGKGPFSEAESSAVSKTMLKYKGRIKIYVALHTYGQYLLYPWGYTGDILPSQWKELDTLATSFSQAVSSNGGKAFKVMMAGKMYPASGGSDDYAFAIASIPFCYTMELTEGFEFVFPENLLQSTISPIFKGFNVFSAFVQKGALNAQKRMDDSE